MIGVEKQFFWLACISSARSLAGNPITAEQQDKLREKLRQFRPAEFYKFRAKMGNDHYVRDAYRTMTGHPFNVLSKTQE